MTFFVFPGTCWQFALFLHEHQCRLFFVFLFPLMQTGFLPCGWRPSMNYCTMTMSWTMETSGVSTLTTPRQTPSPRRREREAGRCTATVHMESMYCPIFSEYISHQTACSDGGNTIFYSSWLDVQVVLLQFLGLLPVATSFQIIWWNNCMTGSRPHAVLKQRHSVEKSGTAPWVKRASHPGFRQLRRSVSSIQILSKRKNTTTKNTL